MLNVVARLWVDSLVGDCVTLYGNLTGSVYLYLCEKGLEPQSWSEEDPVGRWLNLLVVCWVHDHLNERVEI